MTTIPFDIEKAKAGAKVVTRDGRSVRLLVYDRKSEQPLFGLRTEVNDQETVCSWNLDGSFWHASGQSGSDLFLSVEPQYRAWIQGEVPVDAWFRTKTNPSDYYRITFFNSKTGRMLLGFSMPNSLAFCMDGTPAHALQHWECSIDNCKTWQICGVQL